MGTKELSQSRGKNGWSRCTKPVQTKTESFCGTSDCDTNSSKQIWGGTRREESSRMVQEGEGPGIHPPETVGQANQVVELHIMGGGTLGRGGEKEKGTPSTQLRSLILGQNTAHIPKANPGHWHND